MGTKPTVSALETLRGKRSLVLSRSTFPGSGSYAGHTTGNNHANFEDLHNSIAEMLSFQMFGIPLVGSDICGYLDDTTEELCSRWMELGAFYPFARNHNGKDSIPQEPYQWPSVAAISQHILTLRYELLPYYYTLFYKASRPVTSTPSATVTRPLFFEFPDDPIARFDDSQFMVGNALLISPIVEEGATSRRAYFPKGRWYSLYHGEMVVSSHSGAFLTLHAPIDTIHIHVRGGTIIPCKGAGLTTAESRQTNSKLLVALDDDGNASGDVYIDDGESINPTQYSFITFAATSQCAAGQLTSDVKQEGGAMTIPPLDKVVVLGLESAPTKAFYNGQAITGFEFNSTSHAMLLTSLTVDLNTNFKITWE